MSEEKVKSWTTVVQKTLKGDVIITDPCYLDEGMDGCWMNNVKQHNIPSLCQTSTLYGDWGCTFYKTNVGVTSKPRVVGKFCADAGMVCCALVKDVLKFNPKFQKFLDKCPWCYTILKRFNGTIFFNKYEIEYEYEGKMCTDHEIRVIAHGTRYGRPFKGESRQTSM